MMRDSVGFPQFERVISILMTFNGMVERLRQIAAWLQTGQRVAAGEELQLFLIQLDRLIAALAEGPPILPNEKELIAELRLVHEDIKSLEEPTCLM